MNTKCVEHVWEISTWGPWYCSVCNKEDWSMSKPPGDKNDLVKIGGVIKTNEEWARPPKLMKGEK